MRFISWNGEVLRVPSAWTTWRIGDVTVERASDGSIVARIDGKWQRVESWQTFEDAPREEPVAS